MELRLNIYQNKTVEKTYTAETYDIMFGTVEDIINVIDLDAISSGDNAELVAVVCQVVLKSMNLIKPLLKDIFPGLTDDELKRCKVKDIAVVLMNVIQFTFAQVLEGTNGKN